MDKQVEYARWLQQKLADAHMTGRELANRAGVSESYVSNLKRGRRHSRSGGYVLPSQEVSDRFAEALGITYSESRMAAGRNPFDDIVQRTGYLVTAGDLPRLIEGDDADIEATLQAIIAREQMHRHAAERLACTRMDLQGLTPALRQA